MSHINDDIVKPVAVVKLMYSPFDHSAQLPSTYDYIISLSPIKLIFHLYDSTNMYYILLVTVYLFDVIGSSSFLLDTSPLEHG